MNKWLKIVQQIVSRCQLLPCHCLLCLEPSRREFALCAVCEKTLPWLGSFSQYDSLPYAGKIAIDSFYALFNYASPINKFISKYKYDGQLHFAKMLGGLMSEHLELSPKVDCIVPVPLHPRRQQERGFNQTLEIAKVVAKQRHVHLDKWSCTRLIDTPSQSSLGAQARLINLRSHIFKIGSQLEGKHVLIIEDIVTSGATIGAFSQALKQAKAQSVHVWSCCRTAL